MIWECFMPSQVYLAICLLSTFLQKVILLYDLVFLCQNKQLSLDEVVFIHPLEIYSEERINDLETLLFHSEKVSYSGLWMV